MTEQELLDSIKAYNTGLPEINNKDMLRLPNMCRDKAGAVAALKRFEALCAQNHVRCVMCSELIEHYEDAIGRRVTNTTYCGGRCAASGRSLLAELKQNAGFGLGG